MPGKLFLVESDLGGEIDQAVAGKYIALLRVQRPEQGSMKLFQGAHLLRREIAAGMNRPAAVQYPRHGAECHVFRDGFKP